MLTPPQAAVKDLTCEFLSRPLRLPTRLGRCPAGRVLRGLSELNFAAGQQQPCRVRAALLPDEDHLTPNGGNDRQRGEGENFQPRLPASRMWPM
ncbi:hypothetical protein [Micromonospora sp. NPDC049891]|uniref:hypothetical protein n=1 Tax=Micromonospora sp. NPDC049891 TaxID=3155655 RepID=UPI003400A129